jgi:hypothetical protein
VQLLLLLLIACRCGDNAWPNGVSKAKHASECLRARKLLLLLLLTVRGCSSSSCCCCWRCWWLLPLPPLHHTHQQLDAAWHADHVHHSVLWRLLRCGAADHVLCHAVLQDMCC